MLSSNVSKSQQFVTPVSPQNISKQLIRGSRWSVDDQGIELTPGHVGQELLNEAIP
jgi:hypothetical protein